MGVNSLACRIKNLNMRGLTTGPKARPCDRVLDLQPYSPVCVDKYFWTRSRPLVPSLSGPIDKLACFGRLRTVAKQIGNGPRHVWSIPFSRFLIQPLGCTCPAVGYNHFDLAVTRRRTRPRPAAPFGDSL